ncbi:MAG: hypothetical protein RR531_03945 [Longicatena sp.]
MKKREIVKQKNKLKTMNNFKYLNYAKNACIIMIVLFLVYVGSLANVGNTSMELLLTSNPIVITGFIICGANLYIWYVLKWFIKDIHKLEHIESARINIIVMIIAQFILMNFISAILMILSLVKYFQWNQFSWKKALKEIKKEGQLVVLVVSIVVLIMFISLVFGIYFSVR